MNSSVNKSAPIGIFDSGIGGISIARCIDNSLPKETLIYFADSQFAPYGDLTRSEITTRVNCVAQYLINAGVKAIVIACNTATVNAIDQLRAQVNIPIIGVEPAIKPAALETKNGNVGILVTRATAKNARFLSLVEKYKGSTNVFIQPCPGLVQLIEQGQHRSAQCMNLLQSFILPLKAKSIDTLVLGCTHYPLVAEQIKQIAGNEINLLETAQPVTQELFRQLKANELLSTAQNKKTHSFRSSADTTQMQHIVRDYWPSELTFTHHKDI